MLNIEELIGETSQYDKKERLEVKKPKSWLKSVSAFANTLGGWLIWGIADDDTVVGIADVKHDMEKISELIKDRMDPVPQIDLQVKNVHGKNIVLLHAFKGRETPYYYTSDGMHTAYVRVGNQSIPAQAHDLKQLVLSGLNQSFDSLQSRYAFSDYTFIKLRRVYKEKTGQDWKETDYQSFGLVTNDGILTNAGALLADESPVYSSRVFCTRWNGLDKAGGLVDALADRELSGSLLSLLQESIEFVRTNSKKRWMKLPTYRVNMPEYPERAVQEAITNALIHRDYLVIGSEVHVDIFDDRMEIYSPGGMFDGSRVQDWPEGEVSSMRRNPVIADLFSRMDLMERRGSGFRKIREDYRNAVLYRESVEPEFFSNQSSFFVVLRNLNYGVTMEQIRQVKERLSNRRNILLDLEKQPVERQKQPVALEKQPIEPEKQPVAYGNISFAETLLVMNLQKRTKEHICKIHEEYGTKGIFGRSDIMHLLNRSDFAAKNLLRKMKEAHLLEPVSGHGKGRYRFIK